MVKGKNYLPLRIPSVITSKSNETVIENRTKTCTEGADIIKRNKEKEIYLPIYIHILNSLKSTLS